MRPSRDRPDGQPRLTIQDLAEPVNLKLQRPTLSSRELGEGLDRHVNALAGAPLVPDSGDNAIDDQYRIVAGLA